MTPEEKKEQHKLAMKKYYEANKDKINERAKQYYEANKDKIKQSQKKFYENKKNEILENRKLYYDLNKDKILLDIKQYKKNNKEDLKEKAIEYRKNNKDSINEYKRKYNKERQLIDSLFKLSHNIRENIRQTLKKSGFKKLTRTEQILGCTFNEFKLHLESQFEPWMSWDNYGNPKDGIYELNKTWDLDHIIAISTATNELELIKLSHYTNYQPLCSYHNRWVKNNNPIL